jgi:hypothetical protein
MADIYVTEICFIVNVAIVNSSTFYDKVKRYAGIPHDNVELQYKLNGSEGKFSSLRTVQRKK